MKYNYFNFKKWDADAVLLTNDFGEWVFVTYDTLVYTGYTIDEIKSDSIMRQALTHIGILIDGPYIDALNDNKSIRGSSNQHIMVLRKPLADRYKDVDEWERKSQTVYTDNCLYSIGIPHNVK